MPDRDDSPAVATTRERANKQPADLKARRMLADALVVDGRVDEALSELASVARAFAEQGLGFRAIALSKHMLTLDPAHTQTLAMLAELYGKRAGPAIATHAAPPPLPDDHGDVAVDAELDADDVLSDGDDAEIALDAIGGLVEKAAPTQVAHIPLFSQLSPDSLRVLIERMRAWDADTGTTILHEGERSDGLFVLVRGRVRVEKATAQGEVVTMAELRAGEFFGELSLLSDRPRSASVVALEPCELLEMSRADVAVLQQNDPAVADVMERFAVGRVLHTTLRTSPLLSSLSAADKRTVLKRFQQLPMRTGAILVERGQPSAGLFIVLRGECDVTASTELGPLRLHTLGAGEVFGEMSLVADHPARAQVVARADGRLLFLPRSSFTELVTAIPALQAKVMELAASRSTFNEQFLPADDERPSASV
jgi:cAMP-dependent protein kinase regulator